MKNFRVGFSIFTCLTLIKCQSNIKNKNFYYLGAGVKSKIFQLEFSFFGDYAKIMIENTCKGKPIEFLEYKVENIDNFVFFLLKLIQSKGGLLSASIFILYAVVHFVPFEDGSRREPRQLLFQ
jgi:hypothetical protein